MFIQQAAKILAAALALLFFAASLAGAWFTGMTIGTGANLSGEWAIWGQDVSGLCVAVLGVSASGLKTVLPLHIMRPPRPALYRCLLAWGLWLLCLAYCWCAVVLTALQSEAIENQSLPILIFLAGAWGLVEVAAGLLPTTLWTPVPWHLVPMPTPTNASPERIEPDLPVRCETDFKDVLSLLRYVSDGANAEAGLENIRRQADGIVLTSQSALARALRVSKSTVHRQLTALQNTGQIRLSTTAQHTTIELLQVSQSRSG